MIPFTYHHLWWGRSEVVIIYPEQWGDHPQTSQDKPVEAGLSNWGGNGAVDLRGMIQVVIGFRMFPWITVQLIPDQ